MDLALLDGGALPPPVSPFIKIPVPWTWTAGCFLAVWRFHSGKSAAQALRSAGFIIV